MNGWRRDARWIKQLDSPGKCKVWILVPEQRNLRRSKIQSNNQSRRASAFQLRKVLWVDEETQLTSARILDGRDAAYFDRGVASEITVQPRRYLAQFHMILPFSILFYFMFMAMLFDTVAFILSLILRFLGAPALS
jgi:hypothetical protein